LRSTSSRNPDPAPLTAPDGEPLVAIGELVGVHGIRGEMRMRPFNADSTVLDDVDDVFLVGPDAKARLARSLRARPHGNVWLITLEGVTTPERGRELVGTRIAVREADLPDLEPGQFYCYQLVGLDVVLEGGERVGTVAEVLSLPGNDVLVVHGPSREERMIPMVDQVVRSVDLAQRTILVEPIDGLFD
jgi:16S rRNA processing protein RimM